MRNVYLSFLGTNKYLKCIYTHPDLAEERPSRYVQDATLRLFDSLRAASRSEKDCAYFFLTDEARRCNWQAGGYTDAETGAPSEGLENCIADLNLSLNIKVIAIPKGENETELWEIFDLVYQTIQEGDRITFDVTHAFRSIPMFALVILAYARTLKEASVEKIYYGAFETLGPLSQAQKKPLEERRAPIFDLTSFIYLLDWTVAIDRFFKAGDSASIAALARDRALPILKNTKGQASNAQELRRIADRLEELGGSLSTARLTRIGAVARDLAKRLATFKSVDLVKPFGPLLDRLKKKITYFQEDHPVRDGIQAAKWCLEHNLVQQGYTILQETVFTHLLCRAGQPFPPHEREMREIAGQAFKIFQGELPEKDWKAPASRNVELTRALIQCIDQTPGLADIMHKLTKRRNDLNHAGSTKDAVTDPRRFQRELKTLVDTIERALLYPSPQS